MANAMLTVMHTLGFDDMTSFGDSTGALDLTSAGTTTAAAPAGVTAMARRDAGYSTLRLCASS